MTDRVVPICPAPTSDEEPAVPNPLEDVAEYPFAPREPNELDREIEVQVAAESARGEPMPPAPIGSVVPRVRFAHGRCLVDWPAPHYVRLEFDRFVNSREELHAELIVRYTAPGLERQLYQARMNLMAPRTRSDVGSALGKIRADIKWADFLGEAVTAAIGAYRDGEPAILLRDAPVRLATPYLLPPVLLSEFPTILFGRGGDGKSLLALAMALSVHTGRGEILGLAPSRATRVLFLDFEFSASEHRERMAAMLHASDVLPDIAYLRCSDALWDEHDRIQRAIRDHGAEYLVIDSVGMACGGIPPENSEAALRFNAEVRRLGLGALCIAHMVKDGSDEYPFGSVFWHNSARSTWLVRRESEPESRPEVIGLYQKKANVGRRVAPVAFEVTIDGDDTARIQRVAFTRRDPGEIAIVAQRLSLTARLTRSLRAGPRILAEVADELDAKPDTIERTMRRYPKLFTRVSSADGVYRIALVAREETA